MNKVIEKSRFLAEVERQTTAIYSAMAEEFEVPDQQSYHLEGFMRAGIFLELVTDTELNELIDRVHLRIFGMTKDERRQRDNRKLPVNEIDYSQYDSPTYIRK